jgi:phosphate acetyltransferase
MSAQRLGLIEPIMIGPRAKIEAIAHDRGIGLAKASFVETSEAPLEAAAAAVELCRNGKADLIMKGSLHTDALLGAVVARDGGCGPAVAPVTPSSSTCRATPSRC